MKPTRLNRINSLLKEVISEVIHRDVKNPHIHTFISVVQVDTSADLHHAKVFVSLIGTEEEKKSVLAALETAAGFIAVHAAKKAQLRYFPNLTFKLDRSTEEYMRIQTILTKIEQEKKSRPDQDE